MSKVKLTFEKTDKGDKVTITKEGGFHVDDMTKLTEVVEELFEEVELEDGEPDRQEDGDAVPAVDMEESEEDDAFTKRVKREAKEAAAAGKQKAAPGATPPDGRGEVQEKLSDGTGIKSDGTVDRRTLKGDSQNPDPKQQTVVKRAMQSGKVAKPEART